MSQDSTTGMTADLIRYLQRDREKLVAALEGLGEYDVRRPLTPTGTNLLGLVKHLAGVELGYFGECVGRPRPDQPAWMDEEALDDSADMWATAEETREEIVGLYRAAWAHTAESIAELGPDAPATVPWWSEDRRNTTLGRLLVHVVSETAQHAGHADIIRETIDGRAGRDHDSMGDADWWTAHVARIEAAAKAHLG